MDYPSLKIFLQYLDPNKRVSLVRRCPSLKAPDREVPQRIESLCVMPNGIKINNKIYKMGIVRQYPKGAVVPKLHVEINSRDGLHYDVDSFGFKNPTPYGTPGCFPLMVLARRPEEEDQNYYEGVLRSLKQSLQEMLKQKETLELFVEMRMNGDHRDDRYRKHCLRDLNEDIEGLKAEIVQFQLKVDNNEMDIPFTLLLQLTIFEYGSCGWVVRERMQYTRSIGSAVKYLIGKLLNKRMNYVKELRIVHYDFRDCFWLPAELNLAARDLIIEGYYEAVRRTVGEFFRHINRRPFRFIAHESKENFLNYDFTKALLIKEMDPSLQIHTIRYSILHFDFCPNYADFVPLIDHWQINGARLGTWYTAFTTPMQLFDWYNSMRGREGNFVVEKHTRWCRTYLVIFVIFPLPNDTQLEFYAIPIRNHRFRLLLNFEIHPQPWN